jgi:hypothetical protein
MGKSWQGFVRVVATIIGAVLCLTVILSPLGILILQNAAISEQLEDIARLVDKNR